MYSEVLSDEFRFIQEGHSLTAYLLAIIVNLRAYTNKGSTSN